MVKYADRVAEQTGTTGTGALTLGGAATGGRTFADGFTSGDEITYTVENSARTEWETGTGTYTTGSISRDTVSASSNGGALVDFSGGVKTVFATVGADRLNVLGGIVSVSLSSDQTLAAAQSNSTAIAEAIASIKASGGGRLVVGTPGTYALYEQALLPSDFEWYSAPGVEYTQITNYPTTWARNEHWSAPLGVITSISEVVIPQTTLNVNIVALTSFYDGSTSDKTLAVGEHVIIKGDPSGAYNGVWLVTEVVAGVSFTFRVHTSIPAGSYPTVTFGTTLLGIAGASLAASISTSTLSALVGTNASPNAVAFQAPLVGGDGYGAVLQIGVEAVTSGRSIVRVTVMDPGSGYTTLPTDIDLSTGGGSTITLASLGITLAPLSVAKANHNIKMIGGKWTANYLNTGHTLLAQDPLRRMGFVWNRVKNLSVDQEGGYCDLYLHYPVNTLEADFKLKGKAKTFCQGVGWLRNIRVSLSNGETGDDASGFSVNNGIDSVSPFTNDYTSLDVPDINGPVDGFTTEAMNFYTCSNLMVAFCGRGYPVRRITYRNIAVPPMQNPTGVGFIVYESVCNTRAGPNRIELASTQDVSALRIGMLAYVSDDGFAVVTGVTPGSPHVVSVDRAFGATGNSRTATFMPGVVSAPRSGSHLTVQGLATGVANSTMPCEIEDLTIEGLSGDGTRPAVSIAGVQGVGAGNSGTTIVRTLILKNCAAKAFRAFSGFVSIDSSIVNTLLIADSTFRLNSASGAKLPANVPTDNNRCVVWATNGGRINNGVMTNCVLEVAGSGEVGTGFLQIDATAIVGSFSWLNCNIVGLTKYQSTRFVQSSSTTSPLLSLTNCRSTNGGPIATHTTGATIKLNGVQQDGFPTSGMLSLGGTSKTYNVYLSQLAPLGSGASVFASYGTTNTINLKASDGSVLLDGTKITASPGSMFYNTNAAYSAGVGLYGTGAGAPARLVA